MPSVGELFLDGRKVGNVPDLAFSNDTVDDIPASDDLEELEDLMRQRYEGEKVILIVGDALTTQSVDRATRMLRGVARLVVHGGFCVARGRTLASLMCDSLQDELNSLFTNETRNLTVSAGVASCYNVTKGKGKKGARKMIGKLGGGWS